MAITTTRTGRIATARELADTVVTGEEPVLSATADGFELVDQHSVTYTGTPSHLALLALIRPDLTPQLYRDAPTLQDAVRTAASRIGLWFTCEHVDPDHAAAFAALTPSRACELVAHVANRGHDSALAEVGPESLRFYTAYLISDAIDDPDAHFPNVVDKPRRGLTPVFDDRIPLDITATAPGDADEVSLRLDIKASEENSWDFVAAVPVPIAKLNRRWAADRGRDRQRDHFLQPDRADADRADALDDLALSAMALVK